MTLVISSEPRLMVDPLQPPSCSGVAVDEDEPFYHRWPPVRQAGEDVGTEADAETDKAFNAIMMDDILDLENGMPLLRRVTLQPCNAP